MEIQKISNKYQVIGDNRIYSIEKLDTDTALIAVEFNNATTTIYPDKINSRGKTDFCILKINYKEIPNIVTKQVNTVGGIDEDLIEAATATSDGGMVVAVSAKDIITLEYGDEIYTTKSKESFLIIKYNEKRQIEWIDEINTSLIRDSYAHQQNHIYAICETKDKEIIVGISGLRELTFSNGESINFDERKSTCLVKYSENRRNNMV